MTVILGLTGSIGMGKSTTAAMFKQGGIPVFDADATVHELYKKEAVEPIEKAFPGTSNEDGIDRKKLSAQVLGNPDALKKLEQIIHPLVQKKRQDFIEFHREQKTPLIVLDIPLLFETKAEDYCDVILVVTAKAEIQKQRVLDRGTMTPEQFEAILIKQLPDHEKRKRADHIIETDFGLEYAQQQVQKIIQTYKNKAG